MGGFTGPRGVRVCGGLCYEQCFRAGYGGDADRWVLDGETVKRETGLYENTACKEVELGWMAVILLL